MNSFRWLLFALVFLFFSAKDCVVAQPLAVNPSAAASDVRNPSSTNPSAAASDIRNPSATNPSAAASQIPQPSAISSRPGAGLGHGTLPARRLQARRAAPSAARVPRLTLVEVAERSAPEQREPAPTTLGACDQG